jgi:hypothetical protein
VLLARLSASAIKRKEVVCKTNALITARPASGSSSIRPCCDWRIYRAQHDFTRAIAKLDEVEPRLRSALPPGHYAFAGLASERSQTLELKGDMTQALDFANLAIRICDEASKAATPRAAPWLKRRRINWRSPSEPIIRTRVRLQN